MQRIRKSPFLGLFVLTLLALLAHPVVQARAAGAWSVLYNGLPSELAVSKTESGDMVPISFAVPPDGQRHVYTVWLETDQGAQQVRMAKVKKAAPVRGPGDCRWCSGSRKCQDCYPAGSKVNTAGLPCIGCNATGACNFCHGSGVCWTCDGKGFDNGCPDCSKVVAKQQ